MGGGGGCKERHTTVTAGASLGSALLLISVGEKGRAAEAGRPFTLEAVSVAHDGERRSKKSGRCFTLLLFLVCEGTGTLPWVHFCQRKRRPRRVH
jgi:hypothetical protein